MLRWGGDRMLGEDGREGDLLFSRVCLWLLFCWARCGQRQDDGILFDELVSLISCFSCPSGKNSSWGHRTPKSIKSMLTLEKTQVSTWNTRAHTVIMKTDPLWLYISTSSVSMTFSKRTKLYHQTQNVFVDLYFFESETKSSVAWLSLRNLLLLKQRVNIYQFNQYLILTFGFPRNHPKKYFSLVN